MPSDFPLELRLLLLKPLNEVYGDYNKFDLEVNITQIDNFRVKENNPTLRLHVLMDLNVWVHMEDGTLVEAVKSKFDFDIEFLGIIDNLLMKPKFNKMYLKSFKIIEMFGLPYDNNKDVQYGIKTMKNKKDEVVILNE
jgi:hypothetical protein